MRTIWKYPLRVTPEQYIDVPILFTPLCVQLQRRDVGFKDDPVFDMVPTLWCLVTPTQKITRRILTFGTGFIMPDDPGAYIDTYQLSDGTVWHVFDSPVLRDL